MTVIIQGLRADQLMRRAIDRGWVIPAEKVAADRARARAEQSKRRERARRCLWMRADRRRKRVARKNLDLAAGQMPFGFFTSEVQEVAHESREWRNSRRCRPATRSCHRQTWFDPAQMWFQFWKKLQERNGGRR